MDRGSELVRLMSTYAPQSFPASTAVPTVGVVGPEVLQLYADLESYEPALAEIAKWRSVRYEIPAVANIVRPRFDPSRFAIGVYAWRAGAPYLSQDIILGSSGDGLLTYYSGDWSGRPHSAAWGNILDLGALTANSGDFGAYDVGGGKTFLRDHRISSPTAMMFAPAAWRELDMARLRARSSGLPLRHGPQRVR